MDIKGLLDLAKVTPKKEFDQYFLWDDKTLAEEVSLANLTPKDVVLEVGAGIGNLTLLLSKKAKVIAVEKDYSFTHVLKSIPNTEAVMGDALDFLESLRGKRTPFNKIVSNIPYSISQQLVIEFFRHKWETAVLITQKEFADKLKSKERLGLIMSDMAEVKVGRTIPANCFYPVAVPSAIVVLKQKKQLDEELWKFMLRLKPNKNAGSIVKKAPPALAKKKIHQLTLAEWKTLYSSQRN